MLDTASKQKRQSSPPPQKTTDEEIKVAKNDESEEEVKDEAVNSSDQSDDASIEPVKDPRPDKRNDRRSEDQKLLDMLVEQSYILPKNASDALKYAKRHHCQSIDFLLSEGIVTRDLIGQAWAEFYKVPYANLSTRPPLKEQVNRIPEALAKDKCLVLFKEEDKEVTIATDHPTALGVKEKLKKVFKESKITFAYANTEDIKATFSHYRKQLDLRFVQIIKDNAHIAPEIIDEIIKDALTLGASDIHFEPQDEEVHIRMRIDGVLQEAAQIPKQYYENILNRIKVQAHLRIDEHSTPQDGALRHPVEGQNVDMRISITPVLDGEKVVIRLLSQYLKGFTFNDLGLSAMNAEELRKSSKKPFGMILTTGPTGSGKTTTLYGVLKMLNHPEVNIATIEDPVEYKISGVNHIQVNADTGLNFAEGLRSIVRQDPDIILVGEIRDNETAEIAVNAALTGHLVLSTFHSNDASTALPRLLDMGVEPFLLASTMEAVVAQRLVRRICLSCRYRVDYKRDEMEAEFNVKLVDYFPEKEFALYQGKGCDNCHQTGYKSRIAIFEFLTVTPQIKELIMQNPSAQDIWKLALKQGARSLFEDGIDKVRNGITTLEELLRIAPPPTSS